MSLWANGGENKEQVGSWFPPAVSVLVEWKKFFRHGVSDPMNREHHEPLDWEKMKGENRSHSY